MAEQTQAVEQPATESTEQPSDLDTRLDALFGSAEPEQPEGGQAPADEAAPGEVPEPSEVEVEFNGTRYTVPPELKDALMAQSDYTAKTTDLANTRKAIEAQQKEISLYQEQRAFEQSVAADLDHLKMLDAYVRHEEETLGKNWSQLNRDQRQDKQFEIDRLDKQRRQLAEVLQKKHAEFAEKMNGERSKLKESAKEVLSKAIPNWSDEVRGSVEKYAQSLGYPEVAVQNMSALDAQVAWKAMQYDKLKAETKQAVKRADAPVITPTARRNPMPKQVRAKLDLKNAVKSGKKDAIAPALDKRLEQIFGG